MWSRLWSRITARRQKPDYETLAEIKANFKKLAEENGGLINRFQDAFEWRAKDASLCEHRDKNGLMLALTGLLWQSPPDKLIDGSGLKPQDTTRQQTNQAFADHFCSALDLMAESYPNVIDDFKKHTKRCEVSNIVLLRALLAHYADKKYVYPY